MILEEALPNRSLKKWLIIVTLTLLLHFLFFSIPWDDFLSSSSLPPSMPISQIDPNQLKEIKKKWKQKFVLQNPKKESTRPKNAKFLSKTNQTVEKETRAKYGDVIPKEGNSNMDEEIPQLKSLGVPIDLSPSPNTTSTQKRKTPSKQTGGTRSAEQWLIDKDLALGSENLLNTERSQYYSFYSRMSQVIGPTWKSEVSRLRGNIKVPPGTYQVIARVVFDDEGKFLDLDILQSSGIPAFDQTIYRTFQRAKQFPNPPKDLVDESGRVSTDWSFTIQADGYQF
ncbi:MAG: hypothetical protein CL678_09695 [Bdellovibrionaceae bacterium]|nr:hypothetical protein [Pseudobdellovibrionaceae bacterium]|tara:strand:- start:1696 stop:2544 length:849 start_codon:yes stop_codon:yes gene_type:complete